MSKIHQALARALEEENSPQPEEARLTSALVHDHEAMQMDKSIESEQVYEVKETEHPPKTKEAEQKSFHRSNRGIYSAPATCSNHGLIVLNDPSSAEAENFRMLRTRIFHPVKGKSTRCILVTSTIPEEGKSFVSANLAAAIALGMEKHVLLIDADLRRPTQSGIFCLDNSRGLVNHLRDGEDLSQLIQKTQLEKLSVITSGKSPLNPSEIVDSKKMSSMIEETLNRYHDRVIIIDSPPIQSAAETTVLSKYVDGVVLVIRWGQANKEQIRKAAELIGSEKILGIVFNQCPPKSLKDQYHAYYGYKS